MEKTSEEGVKPFEPELLQGICPDHVVCNHIHVSQPLQTVGTASERPAMQCFFSFYLSWTNTAKARKAYGYLGTRSMHAAISLLLLLLSWSSHRATNEASANSLETGAPYNCVSKAYGSFLKQKPKTNKQNPTKKTLFPILISL